MPGAAFTGWDRRWCPNRLSTSLREDVGGRSKGWVSHRVAAVPSSPCPCSLRNWDAARPELLRLCPVRFVLVVAFGERGAAVPAGAGEREMGSGSLRFRPLLGAVSVVNMKN